MSFESFNFSGVQCLVRNKYIVHQKMKNQILFATLAVLVAYSSGAAIERIVGDRRLDVGTVGAGDTVLYRNVWHWPGFPEAIVGKDILYTGSTPITAIRVTEIGNYPFSVAAIVEGGLGQTFATIRIGSARSHGYNLVVEVWGRN